ncbi:MAG: HEAT repeat domain-containing protein [Deltaproteobacteria bacterium]|nr:HEAT repeat domain-containing protein [Deltaproteobacteria bacterium]
MTSVLAVVLLIPLAAGLEVWATVASFSLEQAASSRGLAIFGLHLGATVTIAEALRMRYRKMPHGRRSAWWIALCLSLALPIFGVFVVALLVIKPPPARSLADDVGLSPMEHRKIHAEGALAAEAERGTAGVEVEAIADVLKDRNPAKRLGAVDVLRQQESRQAVDMLQASLENTVFEVRYHAVEALAALSKKYSNRIAEATALVEREPTPENHASLANLYFEYAELGVEEQTIQQQLYGQAAQHFGQAGADPTYQLRRAACFDKMSRPEEALFAYQAALKRDANNHAALFGLAQIQYRQGLFDALRQTCRRLLACADLPTEHRQAVQMWAERTQ